MGDYMSAEEERKLYAMACRLADEAQESVLVVRKPKPSLEQDLWIPYVVYAAGACPWDVKHGERVEPRRAV